MPRSFHGTLFMTALSLSSTAWAHLTLNSPVPRHPASDLKEGPCGVGPDDQRTIDPGRVTTYQVGQTITVTWTEVIDHDPAHYRIAFSPAGDAFEDPTGYDDIRTEHPILLDGIPDADAGKGHVYSVDVTLPSEPCDACSLQVIQVMHDKPPWGPGGGDDIYYQCADIVLIDAGPGIDPPPGGAGSTGAPHPPATGGTDGFGIGDPDLQQGTGSDGSQSGGVVNSADRSGQSGDSGGCSLNPARTTNSARFLLLSMGVAGLLLRRKRKSARL